MFLFNKDNKITGFNIKRPLTFDESKYILHNIFKVYVDKRSDFFKQSDYNEFCNQVILDINKWLRGRLSDDAIIDTYFDDDNTITLKGIFKVIDYLNMINVL